MSQTIADNDIDAPGPPRNAQGFKARAVGYWHRFHMGALLAHVGLTLVFTWPLALNFFPGSTHLTPGTLTVDRDQNLWNLWWVGQAITNGQNPFVTDYIWYPTPVSLYYHTLNLFNGLLVFPFLGIFSLTILYNLIVLFSFVMAGYGAFLLVHYICGNRWAALVGSVVFAYSAYHIATMRGLLQLISLEWMPFFILFLLKAVYDTSWRNWRDATLWALRRALPAAFFLFLIVLVDWYYTLYALMLAGLLGVYVAVRYFWDRSRPVRDGTTLTTIGQGIGEPWARISLCIGIFLLLASPILVPTLSELRTSSYILPAQNAALSNSADLLAFFQPPRDQRLWGRFFTNRQDWPFGSNRYEVYFTYTALALGGFALFATRRLRPRHDMPGEVASSTLDQERLPGKWFWASCIAIFFLLALGPVLQVNGEQIGWLPMPYRLLESLPVFNISRSPDRFDMPLTLCLGVLTGYGTNVVASRLNVSAARSRGSLVAIVAVIAIGVELAPMPYVQRPAVISTWYFELGKEAGDFSILELPPQDDYWHGAFRMYNQTAHKKRIFGGYISREFQHPFLTSTPGYQELTYADGAADMFDAGPSQWYSAFAVYDTRYVVLQKVRLPERQEEPVDVSSSRAAIRQMLGDATPRYEDDQLAAYAIPLPTERVPFLSVGDGWQPREVGPNGAFRWMGQEATLRIDSPRRMDTYLQFRATSLGKARALQIFHGGTKVFEGEVGPLTSYTVGPLGLPQGVSHLSLKSLSGTDSPAGLGLGDDPRQLSFAILGAKLDVNQP